MVRKDAMIAPNTQLNVPPPLTPSPFLSYNTTPTPLLPLRSTCICQAEKYCSIYPAATKRCRVLRIQYVAAHAPACWFNLKIFSASRLGCHCAGIIAELKHFYAYLHLSQNIFPHFCFRNTVSLVGWVNKRRNSLEGREETIKAGEDPRGPHHTSNWQSGLNAYPR